MDISSLTASLLPLQTTPPQDAIGNAAADGGTAPSTAATDGGGQNLPDAAAQTANVATGSGATAPVLSSDLQAFLLQTQEADQAASLLLSDPAGDSLFGGDSSDPLLSALSDSTNPLTGSAGNLTDPFASVLDASSPTSTNDPTQTLQSLLGSIGSGSDALTGGSAADPSMLMALQSMLGAMGASATGTTSIDSTTQSLLDMLGGVSATTSG